MEDLNNTMYASARLTNICRALPPARARLLNIAFFKKVLAINNLNIKLRKQLVYSSMKKNKILGINLIVWDLYAINYKTLLKETKDLSKWESILRSWIGRLFIWRRHYSPKWSTESVHSHENPPAGLFGEIDRLDPKIQGTPNSQNSLIKEQIGRI